MATAHTDTQLKPGVQMPDGTVYAGISPDTGKPIFVASADVGPTTFNQVQLYASDLDAHGHKDWRLPTKSELDLLFKHRASIGGFDESGSHRTGWYWSDTQADAWVAWGQRFSDGYQTTYFKDGRASARLVRTGP